MRTPLRWVLNGVTVLSLVLALAVAASWLRSYWRGDWISFDVGQNWIVRSLDARRGHLRLEIARGRWINNAKHHNLYFGSGPPTGNRPLVNAMAGIEWQRWENSINANSYAVSVDVFHMYYLALFAALPVSRLYHSIGRHRLAKTGHCRICGYDLRATPDRCPECGMVPEKVKA
jgi:hypothetical protein